MPRPLVHSVSSDYLHAAHLLSPRKKRRRIVAYVEGYEDIAFWHAILTAFENEERYFEVMLPASRTLTHGKHSVLKSILANSQLGDNLIACVDSDYDFLLQGRNEVSRQMNGNAYVFQTYCYAIENFRCYAPSLHGVCVKATLRDCATFSFERFMEEYSEAVYPLLLWNVFFYMHNQAGIYPMKRFKETTAIRDFSRKNPRQAIDRVGYMVRRELDYWASRFPHYVGEVDKLRPAFSALGLTPRSAYLYMQGHHVLDNVVMKVLGPVCTQLRREQEELIRRKAQHAVHLDNELTNYTNSLLPLEKAVKENSGFGELIQYRWIMDDLAHVFPMGASAPSEP